MNRILPIYEVEKLTNLSRSTISRLEKKGIFPKRVKLGTHRIGWNSEDIQRWMKNLSIKRGSHE